MSVKVDLSRALSRAVEKANVETLNEAVVLLAVAKNQAAERANATAAGRTQSRPAAVAAPSSRSSCGGVVGDLLARYFPENLAWATRVVKRESNCTPGAVNHEGCDTSGRTNSHAYGLFQMCYPLHQSIFAAVGCSDPLDAECGVKAARRLYDGAGAGPWGG